MSDLVTCSVCSREFDIEGEGGIEGLIGLIPIVLCPTCKAGVWDMVLQDQDE
jgi:hypothetical protein